MELVVKACRSLLDRPSLIVEFLGSCVLAKMSTDVGG